MHQQDRARSSRPPAPNTAASSPERKTRWPSIAPVVLVCVLCVSLLCRITPAAAAESGDLEGLCRRHLPLVKSLFRRIDLAREGLGEVEQAVEREDWPRACRELLAYYRNCDSGEWLRRSPPVSGNGTVSGAEAILRDRFTFYSQESQVPRRPAGGLDWDHKGPSEDREWAWALNRHYHIRTLLNAYFETGNDRYVRCMDRHLRDWVLSNPYPDPERRLGDLQWRGLEVFFRVRIWARCFYALQQDDGLSAATRILLLSSIPDHAHYLRHFHAAGGNWITMEMNGLLVAGAAWPEFERADDWRTYAVDKMLPEVDRQVYPDGAQKELTCTYHYVALRNFEQFADVLRNSGRSVPPEFQRRTEKMWNYLACVMRPNGKGVLNNDADLLDLKDRILDAERRYDRPDWTWIATNGERGKEPEGLASRFFPWAGQMVMRSGWEAGAHWAFFDVGPAGIGHQHRDRLHLSVRPGGRDVLVDGGRFTYRGGRFRNYFVGSASHNVILIDGKGQSLGARQRSEPVPEDSWTIAPDYDYAAGRFAAGYRGVEGRVNHSRAVLYVRSRFWIVLDRVSTDRPRDIEVLWHYHPDCSVRLDGLSVASTDEGMANLRITPVAGPDWQVQLVEGQTSPRVQGWWSREYNHKEPNPTAVYRAHLDGGSTFAWLLLPDKGSVPRPEVTVLEAEARRLKVRVKMRDLGVVTLGIPLDGGPPAVLESAE